MIVSHYGQDCRLPFLVDFIKLSSMNLSHHGAVGKLSSGFGGHVG